MKEIFRKYFIYFRNTYTAVLATAMSVIFARFYYSSVLNFRMTSELVFRNFYDLVFYNFIALLLPVLGVIMIYFFFDNLDLLNKKEYIDSKSKKFLIARPHYIIGFALSTLAGTAMFTNPIHQFIGTFISVNIVWARLAAVILIVAIRLIQLYNLQSKWQDEIDHPLFVEKPMFNGSNDPDSFKPFHLVVKPLIFIVLYTACYFIISQYLLYLVFSVFYVITALWQSLILIALLPFLIIFGSRAIYGLRGRIKLLRNLRRLKKNGIATVKYRGSRVCSSFLPFLPFSIEIKTNSGDTYLCKVVCSGKVNSPMFFRPDVYFTEHGFHMRGGLLSRHGGSPYAAVVDLEKMGGKVNPTNLIFGFRMQHRIDFPEEEGNKVLIINPTPTSCYAIDGKDSKPIDTGENMGRYTIYTATGIYNTIERRSRSDRFER